MATTELVKLSRMKSQLVAMVDVDEIKDLRDKAEAMRAYHQKAMSGLDIQNSAAEIKIRAERRLGELIAESVRAGNPELSHDGTIGLSDIGITKSQSSRYQSQAAVPEIDFQRIVDDCLETRKELTSKSVCTEGRRYKAKAKKKKRQRQGKQQKKSRSKKPTDWKIIHGDCMEHMKKIDNANLIFADPPYNIGVDYGRGEKADKMSEKAYLTYCKRWMTWCWKSLVPDGSMWVLINEELVADYCIILKSVGFHRRSLITWYETFGVNQFRNFNKTSRFLIYCVKDKKQFTFNAEAVNRPSDRQTKYKDKRADPGGKNMDNVWTGIHRIVGNSSERILDAPTQVPVKLLRPIVGCSSNAGDLVVDPFSGVASTGHVAVEMGRKYIGIEREKKFCEQSRTRLTGIQRKAIV